ncbi:YphA family membrane protein [Niallia circulans]|uniref:YphA family membrane protein n=1 Tax=Niallia circulans TaxID=1397 RepID=UPI003D32743F
MEGSIFLFCTWCIWIITTFFMDKNNPKRTKYSIYILTAIILSPYQWEWQGKSCSILLLVVLIMSFFLYRYFAMEELHLYDCFVFFYDVSLCYI